MNVKLSVLRTRAHQRAKNYLFVSLNFIKIIWTNRLVFASMRKQQNFDNRQLQLDKILFVNVNYLPTPN